MVIRYAHPEDHDAAVQLWASVGFPTMSDDEWEVIVRSQTTFALVAEEAGQLIGAALATFDGWRAFLYHVATDEAFRGQGVAKALMAEAEARVAAVGAHYLYALVHEENAAGLALATVMGFEPEGDLVLVKDLVEDDPAAG
ncbi:MAG: GNAT family N-acetyltransferase [Chloroflexi bacterium]|nr:GNAT family N-acetyltransferase [Chloroflexota bacterium]